MKKLLLLLVLLVPITASAQTSGVAYRIRGGTATPPATCRATNPTDIYYRSTTDILYVCSSTNTWTILAAASSGGPGNVVGPASAVDNHLAVFDGTTGKLIKDGGAIPSATPAGSDTQVQFNDSSAFGGDSGLVYNKTTDTLNVGSVLQVGLGATTAPTAFVVGDTAATTPRGLMSWQSSTDTASAHIHMRKSRGTFAAPTTIATGDVLGRVVFAGYEGTTYNESAYFRCLSTGTIAASRVPTKCEFYTSTDAAPSVATLALTLNADQSATFPNTVNATTFVGAVTGNASTASNLSGTPAVPNGTTATTQSQADASTKLATTAYVDTGLGGKQSTLTNSAGLRAALSDELGTGAALFDGATPTSFVLTNATGLPVAGLSNLGTNVGTFLVTPTSANFFGAITDESGTGAVLGQTSATISTPRISQIFGGTAAGSNLNLISTTGTGTTDAIVFKTGTNGGTTAATVNHDGSLSLNAITSDATHTDATVCVDTTSKTLYQGSGTVGICLGTSSARFKSNWQALTITQGGGHLDRVMQLSPGSFFYRNGHGDNGARLQYGFLAEDVVKVLPELVGLDAKGLPNSVDILGMVPRVIVPAMQELNAKFYAMALRVTALEKENRHLRARLHQRL